MLHALPIRNSAIRQSAISLRWPGQRIAPDLALGSLAHRPDAPRLNAELLRGLPLRNIGPALEPGRIADIAVDPRNRSVWYVATASSGLWKTRNRGESWEPIFDDGGSYSLGCVDARSESSRCRVARLG